MPAAVVIPAPLVYIKVKKLIVGSRVVGSGSGSCLLTTVDT